MPPLPNPHDGKFRRALEFIEAHLQEALTTERVSSVATTSKYHFHRQFAAHIGISLYKYVQLSRIKRAIFELAFRNTRILDIAITSGYESNEAFTRAFKSTIGSTPSEFRQNPDWHVWSALQSSLTSIRTIHLKPSHRVEDVKIVTFPETKVAALEHRGSAATIGDSIRRFIAWRRQNRLPPPISATFNVQHQSHPDVADAEYHVDLCAATNAPIAVNGEGVIAKVIPGGRCAVLRHTGSDDTLGATVMFLYQSWLPHSGQEPRDYPLYFQRVHFFPDVPEQDAITDVYLPLK